MQLTMHRGDDRAFQLEVTLAGDPIDLTTAEQITFTAKRRRTDPDSEAVIRKDLAGGIEVDGTTTNLATITIDAADTDALTADLVLVWDVEIVDAEGKVRTVAEGYLRIVADVTRERSA